jgi:hypothetical protein
MTLELLKPDVKRSGRETKSDDVLVIWGTVLLAVLVFSIVGIGIGLGSGEPSTYYPTKSAICTSKVLELAQKGMITDVGGFNGAIYECTHMHGFSSIYGGL